MLAAPNHPELVAARLMPGADGTIPEHFYRQESRFMEHIFRDFYMAPRPRGLGLWWIDSDPFPNPDDPAEREMRRKLMADLGRLNESGLEHIGLFAIDERGRASTADDGLIGLLILAKMRAEDSEERLVCADDAHQPTMIAEWDLRRNYRGEGLGSFLLQLGLHGVHPEDEIRLDVSQDNSHAIDIYLGYEFEPTGQTFEHGIFDTIHERYITSAAHLRRQLGTIALD